MGSASLTSQASIELTGVCFVAWQKQSGSPVRLDSRLGPGAPTNVSELILKPFADRL